MGKEGQQERRGEVSRDDKSDLEGPTLTWGAPGDTSSDSSSPTHVPHPGKGLSWSVTHQQAAQTWHQWKWAQEAFSGFHNWLLQPPEPPHRGYLWSFPSGTFSPVSRHLGPLGSTPGEAEGGQEDTGSRQVVLKTGSQMGCGYQAGEARPAAYM